MNLVLQCSNFCKFCQWIFLIEDRVVYCYQELFKWLKNLKIVFLKSFYFSIIPGNLNSFEGSFFTSCVFFKYRSIILNDDDQWSCEKFGNLGLLTELQMISRSSLRIYSNPGARRWFGNFSGCRWREHLWSISGTPNDISITLAYLINDPGLRRWFGNFSGRRWRDHLISPSKLLGTRRWY